MDEFYDAPATLTISSKGYDTVVMVDDLDAQVGKLSGSEACLDHKLALPAQITDNGVKLF